MNDTFKDRPFDHGGTAREGQLDFSANISPLGMPDEVRSALHDVVSGEALSRYPDPDCTELRAAIAERAGVHPEQVLCGNGAADLIYRFASALRPKRALVLEPTFSEYERALDLCGCEIEHLLLSLETGFVWPEDLPDRLTPDLDLFVFCSPNNPTGVSAPPALLERVLDRCFDLDIPVLWDASFLAFAETPEVYREVARRAFERGQSLTVLNSFTKLYALAGVRLGYLLSPDAKLLAEMKAVAAPWSVSTVAQTAGVAALRCEEYVLALRWYIANEKQALHEGLKALGLRVVPSDANFLLFRSEREDLADVLEQNYDIVLRRAETFRGLDAHWVRAAVRTREENEKLLNALKEVLERG